MNKSGSIVPLSWYTLSMDTVMASFVFEIDCKQTFTRDNDGE